MSGFSGNLLIAGNMSATSTTFATSNAPTVAFTSDETCTPNSFAINERSRTTIWNEMKKKIVGGMTSRISCLIFAQTLFMKRPSQIRSWLARLVAAARHQSYGRDGRSDHYDQSLRARVPPRARAAGGSGCGRFGGWSRDDRWLRRVGRKQ